MPLMDPQLVFLPPLRIKLVVAEKFCEGFGQKLSWYSLSEAEFFKINCYKTQKIYLFCLKIRELLQHNCSELKLNSIHLTTWQSFEILGS
jgi:hypothetical protein